MLASKASTLDEIAATTLVTAAKSRSTSEGARETLVGVARTPVKAPKARREVNAENRIEATKQYQMINEAGEEISTQIDTSRYHPRTI
jgi:hypothetical protein